MSLRRLAALALVALLAAPPAVPVASAAPQVGSGSLQVEVDPSPACVLAGEHPQFQGSVIPMSGVRRTRLFFTSALNPNDVYYVEAVLEGGRYVARLPRPRPEAGPFSFYLEAAGDGGQGRSADANAIVVRKIEECPGDRKAAPVAPGGPVSVFDVAGNAAFPAGFEGVTGAAALGAGAGAAGGVGGAAGAGGFFTSTAGLIALGAVAVGVGTLVIISQDDSPSVASPSR
jgi:hypothetical protein